MVTALFRPFDQLLRDLQEALSIEGLVGDPRFATLAAAVDNRDALRERLAPIFAEKDERRVDSAARGQGHPRRNRCARQPRP